MAALDRRRSISLRASTYRAILADCQRREQSLSDYVEALIVVDLQRRGLMDALAEEIARSHQITASRKASHPAPPSNTPAVQAKQPRRPPGAKDAGGSKPAAERPLTVPPPAPPPATGSTSRLTGSPNRDPRPNMRGTAPGPNYQYNAFVRGQTRQAAVQRPVPPIPEGRDGAATREPERVRMVPRMPGGTVLL